MFPHIHGLLRNKVFLEVIMKLRAEEGYVDAQGNLIPLEDFAIRPEFDLTVP